MRKSPEGGQTGKDWEGRGSREIGESTTEEIGTVASEGESLRPAMNMWFTIIPLL